MSETASFSALFRRSRYAHSKPLDAEAVEPKQKRNELFAVAAVAFVMKHEPSFKKHFLKKICNAEAASVETDDYEVLLQPYDFDLVVLNKNQSEAIVIEFKIDAELECHQDFTNQERFGAADPKPEGYGYQIQDLAKYGKFNSLKYVVLLKGADQPEVGDAQLNHGRLQCHFRTWRDLLYDKEERPEPPLISDLLNWLAENIPELNHRLFASMKMKKFTEEAAKMFGILAGVSAEPLKIRGNQLKIDAKTEQGGSFFGINIPKSVDGFKTLKLHTNSDLLGWFGYESRHNETPRTSVWIYGFKGTKMIYDRVEESLGKINHIQEVEGSLVIFPKNENGTNGDMEWFRSVFQSLRQLL